MSRREFWDLLGELRRGGLTIVQYQQYQFVEGAFAPFPLDIARPHGRVTDETAPTANRGWRRFLWLNFATGFGVTMLLIAYALLSQNVSD